MTNTRRHLVCVLLATVLAPLLAVEATQRADRPNIVLIYADDLGYGDVSCYGATSVATPAIDRLAREGLRFTDAHSPAATCTPSRYAMLTGQYAWRRVGTGIARGDAALILDPNSITLPSLLQSAGYRTGVVGKWHLGLGPQGGPDWNGAIKPGPLETGFDYCFLIPATGDRVPCVYVENHHVVDLDPNDPIQVSFGRRIGDEPTGKENPELLRMRPSHGHDRTIINGISRIGYMTGGKSARWVDEQMADRITSKAVAFIEKHRNEPFFLFFSLHDIHVPRAPHPRFVGRTSMGPRGDAIVQADWSTGEILRTLDRLRLVDDTLVLFTSDNGPVVDDGYQDDAVEKLGQHRPAGPLRGGKYSNFEGGTRVPFVARWPKRIAAGGVSDALLCQIDLLRTLAELIGQDVGPGQAPDSEPLLGALLGDAQQGRTHLVEQGRRLSLRAGDWKYVQPGNGPAVNRSTNTELGVAKRGLLFDLSQDPGEKNNLMGQHPEVAQRLAEQLQEIIDAGGRR